MHPTVAVTGEYDADSALSRSFEIVNKRGLHARASAKFVQLVDSYDAHVRVSKDGMTVGGTSIMGLMMLAASPGCCAARRNISDSRKRSNGRSSVRSSR